jgi:hypothetical protein
MEQAKAKVFNWATLGVAGLTFFLGVGLNAFTNYLTYASKVDSLTVEVAALNVSIQALSSKKDAQDEKIGVLNDRVTVLETVAFGTANKGASK